MNSLDTVVAAKWRRFSINFPSYTHTHTYTCIRALWSWRRRSDYYNNNNTQRRKAIFGRSKRQRSFKQMFTYLEWTKVSPSDGWVIGTSGPSVKSLRTAAARARRTDLNKLVSGRSNSTSQSHFRNGGKHRTVLCLNCDTPGVGRHLFIYFFRPISRPAPP